MLDELGANHVHVLATENDEVVQGFVGGVLALVVTLVGRIQMNLSDLATSLT